MSYSGSVIKMMTALSSIDGIDEDSAFNILQKLPSVVRKGISAKAAMKIGAILEKAGATVELARGSDTVAKTKPAKPSTQKTKTTPKPKAAGKGANTHGSFVARTVINEVRKSLLPGSKVAPKGKADNTRGGSIQKKITEELIKSILK